MQREAKAYLWDIANAAASIRAFTEGKDLNPIFSSDNAKGGNMPNQSSLDDYGKELKAAIEKRNQLQAELETANPERRKYLQSSLDSVEKSIHQWEARVRYHQGPH